TLAVITSPNPARRPVAPPSGRIICSLRAPELSATSSMVLIITAIIQPPCAARLKNRILCWRFPAPAPRAAPLLSASSASISTAAWFLPAAPCRRCEPRSFRRARRTSSPWKLRARTSCGPSGAPPAPRWSCACGRTPLCQSLLCAGPQAWRSAGQCFQPLFLLRFAGSGKFALAGNRLHPRNVLAQATDLLQALRLPHVQLEFQLEQLVVQIALLVPKLVICQIANFIRFHKSVLSRQFLISMRQGFALHKAGAQRQFVRCQTHGLGRLLQRDPFHLKQDLARTHHRDPVVGRSLAFAHTGFGRLLGHRLIGKQPDPDLAAALDETRHRDPAGFDLPVRDPARFQHFQPEITESQSAS